MQNTEIPIKRNVIFGFIQSDLVLAHASTLNDDRRELETCVAVLRDAGKIDDNSTFHGCCIYEPPKDEVAGWQQGDTTDRRLDLVVRHSGEVLRPGYR